MTSFTVKTTQQKTKINRPHARYFIPAIFGLIMRKIDIFIFSPRCGPDIHPANKELLAGQLLEVVYEKVCSDETEFVFSYNELSVTYLDT